MERHPNATWYEQCVTYNAFPSKLHELAYLYFGMFMMYWLPLIVILFCYASIIIEIYRRSRESICGQGELTRKHGVRNNDACRSNYSGMRGKNFVFENGLQRILRTAQHSFIAFANVLLHVCLRFDFSQSTRVRPLNWSRTCLFTNLIFIFQNLNENIVGNFLECCNQI